MALASSASDGAVILAGLRGDMTMNKTMIGWCGILLVVIFAALALLHLYWAAGGRWGISVSIPTIPNVALGSRRAFNPGPFATVVVAVALLMAMLTILGQLGWWGTALPPWIFHWATRGIGVLFFLRAIGEFRLVGFFKRIHDTPFAHWDTWLFSPLCLAIAAIAFLLTYAPRN